MLTIYKYPIPIEDHFTLELPKDARILTVQIQRGTPQLWAVVDPEAEKEIRHFRLSGTGHPLGGSDFLKMSNYIGTFQIENGALVFHLFEIKKGEV
ncbi:hypothetical protein ES703_21535 [subsurface metagenome]